jgi:hypothetical protein
MPTLIDINIIIGEYELFCKWGCDGSSGQAHYRINFSTSQSVTDSDLFMFSFVPLQINYTANDQKKHYMALYCTALLDIERHDVQDTGRRAVSKIIRSKFI